ncbi:Zinc-binding protein A33 [Triplophysa tibetana]|uniref:Zinc-binding protein A33 n=1 Tax=Triplophysa tibetana TaxID=1572043 RepID=A0A5A9PBX6_9TELE|nr:Zinc-binding protein A33 [Triplophysa tibetana]
MKIKCKDSFKIAKDNIDVLVTLQKIIDLQELDVKLNRERDDTKTAKLEARQRESEKDLVDMMKEHSRNVQIVKRAAVLQIVKMQMAAMELMTQTSEKYKRQTQIDVINTKLQDRNDLLNYLKEDRRDAKDEEAKYGISSNSSTWKASLRDTTDNRLLAIICISCCEFTDKHIAAVETEIKGLNAEMSASKQTLLQLKDQNKDANARKKEIMDSIAKLKGMDELNLRKQLFDRTQECTDMMEMYINLQKILLNLIAEIDDNDPTKPMLKIMALQSDVTWIIEMLKTVNDQIEKKKTDLQRKLKNTENLLNEKIKELEAGTSNSGQLDLEEQLKQHAKELNDAAKELKEKDTKIAQQFLKINTLLDEMKDIKQQMQESEARVNARIAVYISIVLFYKLPQYNNILAFSLGLQDNLMKKEEENARIQEENKKLKRDLKKTAECPELKEQYESKFCANLSVQTHNTGSVVKEDSWCLFLTEMQVKYNETVSELNSTVLQKVFIIKNLIDEVEYLDKKLIEEPSDSEALTVLQLLTELWKRQENPTEENLAKISKERIKQLEKEATESRNKAIKLQEEAKKKITSIQEQLTTKSKQLANAENKLQETSAKTADLSKKISYDINHLFLKIQQLLQNKFFVSVKRLNNLNEDLKKVTEQKKDLLKKAQDEISELKKLSEDQRKAIIKQDVKLREKDKTISTVQRERGRVKNELEKQKKKSNELETQLKTNEQQLANTEGVLKKTKDENDALVLKQDELKDDLKILTDKKNNLQEHVFSLALRREEDLVEKERKLKQKDEDLSTLQKECNNSKTELEKEKNKYDKKEKPKPGKSMFFQSGSDLQKKKDHSATVRPVKTEIFLCVPTVSEWPRLDRKTAHRRLVLSEDEREARTALEPQPVPNNPERYDTAIAALGRDGFDGGRHYWEVEVAGRNCYVVGVARASAQRKGLIHYSPKGGYWVILKKRDGRHVALADTPVLLKIAETTKIGVLVDFNSQIITFYDADKKRSVSQFTGIEFLETVYPYIESCSDSRHQ